MKTVNALPYLLVKSVFRSRNITINHFKTANCQPVFCNRLTIGCFGAIMQVIEVPTETMKQSGGVSSEFQVPKTQFTVAQGCDDLCKMCPNNISSVCTSLEKVALMDSAVLSICNLAYREYVPWTEVASKAWERIFETEKFNNICTCCQWFELCRSTEVCYE